MMQEGLFIRVKRKVVGFKHEYRQVTPYPVPKYLLVDCQIFRKGNGTENCSVSDDAVCGSGRKAHDACEGTNEASGARFRANLRRKQKYPVLVCRFIDI